MKKSRVIKRTAIALAVATVFLLTACGGGGGGGSGFPSSNTNPIIRPDTSDQTYYSSGTLSRYGFTSGSRDTVPFSTPTHVSTFNPYTSDSTKTAVSQQHVVNNLTGDGADSMIVTGRMSQPATSGEWVNSSIQLFTWKMVVLSTTPPSGFLMVQIQY
jgi:ABC-type oligopeptide transport system substrate-binding subunit